MAQEGEFVLFTALVPDVQLLKPLIEGRRYVVAAVTADEFELSEYPLEEPPVPINLEQSSGIDFSNTVLFVPFDPLIDPFGAEEERLLEELEEDAEERFCAFSLPISLLF